MKSRTTILFILFACFSTCVSYTQNLVPNYSMEDTVQCPDNTGGIGDLKFWFSPTWGSPDYFNSCSFNYHNGVPYNFVGYQIPRTGNAYAGFGVYNYPSEYREYMEVKLQDSLQAGKKYCVAFYVALSDSSKGAIKEIGIHFSQNSISSSDVYHLLVIPQVENNLFITDTSGWSLISGYFTAQGGEKYITIGNFRDDANTSVMTNTTPCVSVNNCFIYYYIDDVSVTLCDSCPNGAPPTAKFSAQRMDSLKVSFSNDAVGQSNNWHWNFGDGDTSNVENPVHVFDSVGEYDIMFIACDMWCCDTIKLRVDISKLSYVGVRELADVSIGRLYPNPTDGAMFVDYFLKDNQQAVFEISDLFGKVFFRTNLKHGKQTLIINANAIPNGVFFYKTILNDVPLQTEKIVVFR